MFIFINAFVIGFLLHLNQFGCIDLCDVIFVLLRFCYWVSALSMMINVLRFILMLMMMIEGIKVSLARFNFKNMNKTIL